MPAEQSLLSSLLPSTTLKRAILRNSSDGSTYVSLEIATGKEQSSIPQTDSVLSERYGFDLNTQNSLPNIRDYIKIAILISKQNPYFRRGVPTNDDLKRSHAFGIEHTVAGTHLEIKQAISQAFMGTEYDLAAPLEDYQGFYFPTSDSGLHHVYIFDAFAGSEGGLTEQVYNIDSAFLGYELEHLYVVTYAFIDIEDLIGTTAAVLADSMSLMNLDAEGVANKIRGNEEIQVVSNFGSVDILMHNGSVVSDGFVLVDENGLQYNGPFHVHDPDGNGYRQGYTYMKGLVHLDTPHEILQRVSTRTNKVQDFRQFERFEPKPYTADPQMNNLDFLLGETGRILKSMENEFIKRQESFDMSRAVYPADGSFSLIPGHSMYGEARVVGKINIDQSYILESRSKLGFLYRFLTPQQKSFALWWCDMFTLVDCKIIRKRLTPRLSGWDSNGMPTRTDFDQDQPEEIVAINSERTIRGQEVFLDSVLGSSRTMLNPNFNEDYYSPDGLMIGHPQRNLAHAIDRVQPGTVMDERTTNWVMKRAIGFPENFNSSDYGLELQRYEGDPIFPWVRQISFADFISLNIPRVSITSETSYEQVRSHEIGVYQYGIELTYEDGLVKYVQEIVSKMRRLTPMLNNIITTAHSQVRMDLNPTGIIEKVQQALSINYNAVTNDICATFADAATIVRGFYLSTHPSNTVAAKIGSVASDILDVGYSPDLAEQQQINPKLIKTIFASLDSNNLQNHLKDLDHLGRTFELLSTTLASISNLPGIIDSNTILDSKSNGGKAPPLIKVKTFFPENMDAPINSTNRVSGGIANFDAVDLMSISILPFGEGTRTYEVFTPNDVRLAIQLESAKFGGEITDYADRVAFFTPNVFLGSELLDFYKYIGGTGRMDEMASGKSITYTQAVNSLNAKMSARKLVAQKDYENGIEKIQNEVQNLDLRKKALSQLKEEYDEAIELIEIEAEARFKLLTDQKSRGDFLDEDFNMAESFQDLNNSQRLRLISMVARVLKSNRGKYANFENLTYRQIIDLARELFALDGQLPGISAMAELIDANVPDPLDMPEVEAGQECQALSEKTLDALIHNERRQNLVDIVSTEFSQIQNQFSNDFQTMVTRFEENSAGVETFNFSPNTRVDTTPVKNAVFQQKQLDEAERLRQEAELLAQQEAERERQRAERERQEEEARAAAQAAAEAEAARLAKELDEQRRQNPTRVPFQLERVVQGETDFGVTAGEVETRFGTYEPAIYGNFFILQRAVGVRFGNSPRQFQDVLIADALDGLEPGLYRFVPYENSALVKSGHYVLEVAYFTIRESDAYETLEQMAQATAGQLRGKKERRNALITNVDIVVNKINAMKRGEIPEFTAGWGSGLFRRSVSDYKKRGPISDRELRDATETLFDRFFHRQKYNGFYSNNLELYIGEETTDTQYSELVLSKIEELDKQIADLESGSREAARAAAEGRIVADEEAEGVGEFIYTFERRDAGEGDY